MISTSVATRRDVFGCVAGMWALSMRRSCVDNSYSFQYKAQAIFCYYTVLEVRSDQAHFVFQPLLRTWVTILNVVHSYQNGSTQQIRATPANIRHVKNNLSRGWHWVNFGNEGEERMANVSDSIICRTSKRKGTSKRKVRRSRLYAWSHWWRCCWRLWYPHVSTSS